MHQLEFDFDEAERRLVLELWRVDEIFKDASGDLLQKLREDNRIERKPAGTHAEALAIYVSMWANTPPDGGIIALGIEDDGEITGCTGNAESLPDIERRLRVDLVPDARTDVKRVK